MAKILVVDTSKDMRKLTVFLLEEEGFDVVSHSERSGLLRKIESEQPDVLVLEIYFEKGPEMGLDVLQLIRNSYPTLPIIIHTTQSRYAGDRRSLAADYYVIKSAGIDELVDKLSAILNVTAEDSGEDLPAGKPEVLHVARNRFKAIINRQLEPCIKGSHVEDLDHLFVIFKEAGYLEIITEEELYSLYQDLCSWFFVQKKLAYKIAIEEMKRLREAGLVDIEGIYEMKRLYEKLGGSPVMSLQRFTYEVRQMVSLVEVLEIPYFEGTEDPDYLQDRIVRSIEFPPEYHQAGVSILNYFGTVLRKKYPDKRAAIRIEQNGLKVTMVVDPMDGSREVIERILTDYGLVITGGMPLEEFTDDPLLIIDLKAQLRIAQAQIDTQRDLLQHKDAQIDKLMAIVSDAIKTSSHQPAITIQVAPSAQANITQQFQFAPQLSLLREGFKELQAELPEGISETESIQAIQNDLHKLRPNDSPEKVRKSLAMSRIRDFLVALDKSESKIGKTIRTVQSGIELAQRLAEYYNSIAEWCGLPQVPKPLLKKNSSN